MSAARRSRALALATLTVCLTACCGGADYALLEADPRAGLERWRTFALVLPLLEPAGERWGYASDPLVAAGRLQHYRPPGNEGGEVGPLSDAPEPLRGAAERARQTLEELGYRPASAAAAPDFVLSLGLSSGASGRLVRLAVHLGAELDGRFRPDLISLAAFLPDDPDACPIDAGELVEHLLTVLPEAGEAP